jgi:hypothetical protein
VTSSETYYQSGGPKIMSAMTVGVAQAE